MTQIGKNGAVLVVSSGIGGMQSAILLAESGHKVYLLDTAPGIGGSLHLLDNTFPTDSCGICMMLPGRAAFCPSLECSMHDNIELLPLTQVIGLRGGPGSFSVALKHEPRYVDVELCNNCGICAEVCPEQRPDQYEGDLAPKKAIYQPPVRSVPNAYVVDMDVCSRCGECVKVCPTDAIDLEMQASEAEIQVGAIILSPGFKAFDASIKNEYGFGHYPNVLTSLQYERLSSYAGSTGGKIVRPSDGRRPERVAFISCVGSRDPSVGRNYCSSVCCMYSAKLIRVTKRMEPDIEATVFYMDTRTVGKGYEHYLNETQAKPGVRYIRSMPGHVREIPGTANLRVQYAAFDENGTPGMVEEEFDLVVLSVGFDPADGTQALADNLGVSLNPYCYSSADPFEPALTNRPGIFAAGSFSEPKDIPETVIEASSAAASAASLLMDSRSHSWAAKGTYPEERDVSDEDVRMGVFVSECDGDIQPMVNVGELVGFAQGLPGVVIATSIASASSLEGQDEVKQAIVENQLNRVVIAGGAPRTQQPIFEETMRQMGLNANLLELANIREQAAWMQGSGNGVATAMAKSAVRMAASKVRLALPIRHEQLEFNHRVLVLGGGVAGMTAALTFADLGFDVVLVERDKMLGGNLRHIFTGFYGSNPQQLLQDVIRRVEANERITLLLGAELHEFEGHLGAFTSRVEQADGNTLEVDHGVMIVATGALEVETTEYGYGALAGVMTQREYEQLLGTGQTEGDSENRPQSVVMIQCVGSRDASRPYCSRICCAEAIKNAVETKERYPDTQVSILYRDIRTYGFREDLYRDARELGVMFLEYDLEHKPVVSNQNGRLEVQLEVQPDHHLVELDADVVVLSVGIEPNSGNTALAEVLDLPLDQDGFFMEANPKMRPLDFARDGIYLCGLAHSPRSVDEAIAQARGAAMRAASTLVKEKLDVQPNIAKVNPRLCSACGICVDVCPFGARILPGEDGYYAHVIDVLCQGCGTCIAACPNNACQQEGYQARQVLSVIDAALALV